VSRGGWTHFAMRWLQTCTPQSSYLFIDKQLPVISHSWTCRCSRAAAAAARINAITQIAVRSSPA